MKILVVDDSIVYRTAIKTSLANNSDIKEIKTASHGKIAVDMLKLEHFDAMTLDLEMPVMDGVAATRAIRKGEAGEKNKDIPIIAMTAYVMNGDKEKFLEAGMNGYVAKPVEIELLQEALWKVRRVRGRPV
jgi:CheY-like chemotaxis protein